MAPRREERLSRRERQIMDVIYALGGATAVEVVERMDDPPSKTAVRTLLRILEDKGHLRHVEEGRQYVYRPCRPRLHAGRSALQRVLQTFFDGSLEKAVAAHLADTGAQVTAEEYERLTALIQQARDKGKRS